MQSCLWLSIQQPAHVTTAAMLPAVKWVNTGLQPPAGSQCCALAVVDPVGGVQDGQPAPPEALLTSYATEGLLNVYCQRVFEWEQVRASYCERL